ncbi:MAG: NAD(P)H-hydrate dehydratase [Elusimicrobia bacterium]|nr:NAD(P)H-hydrate dehydratase [Elusimicrobiota bacterium]
MKTLSRRELKKALVRRQPNDHKGTYGHLLVLAGSSGMAGAAILSARAALRSGVGLVTLGVPSCIQGVAAGAVPEALTLGLPDAGGGFRTEGIGRIKDSLAEKEYTALAIGPGLSTNPDTAKFVLHVLGSIPLPAVVDADALNNLALQDPVSVRQMLRGRGQGAVFTPHPGEMARCLHSSVPEVLKDREGSARRLAGDWKGVVVLKGHRSVITDGSSAVFNPTGGPGLAKGGAGDLLTGLIGGLWAQLLAAGAVEAGGRASAAPLGKALAAVGGGAGDAFLAAALGAYVHGSAGDLAEKALTPWAVTPSDVLAHFAEAFKKL